MVGKVITYILVCFSGSLTLATVLLMWPELVNGMVVGQQIWFQWLSMIFVGSVAFMWFFNIINTRLFRKNRIYSRALFSK